MTALVLLCLTSLGQSIKQTASVNWERYKISEKEISILLPKMPVLYQNSIPCDETDSAYYGVYAEEVVYQIRIFSKSKNKIPDKCKIKNNFGKEAFEKRLNEWKSIADSGSEKNFTQEGKEVTEFRESLTTHWVFEDLKNDKWVEISMSYRNDIKPDISRFSESIKFEKNPSGKEIGEGAIGALGDEISEQQTEIKDGKEESVWILDYPAKYTDLARRYNTEGTVKLRVTYNANGSIGSVKVVEALPYGLTEQAIAAAKRRVFLPAKKNGKNVTITKLVQFKFTL